MQVGLETVVGFLPDLVVKQEEFSYLDQVTPEGAEKFCQGPDELRRLREDDAVEIMAGQVAQKALKSAGLEPSDIDYIIAGQVGGKYVLPMVGGWIHHKLGFDTETPVLNVSNACGGFVDQCNVAWNLVRAGEYKRILVVVVTAMETGGGGVDPTSPIARIFGDGSCAAIVSSENLKCEILSYANRTTGEIYDHDCLKLSPVENPDLLKPGNKDVALYFYTDEWMLEWLMKQGNRFAVDSIGLAMKKAKLELKDLDFALYHHMPDVLIDYWKDGGVDAGVSREKWVDTWNKYGNMGGVDIGVTLSELWEAGKLQKGSTVGFFGPGAGGHGGAMIVNWLN
jgi:3-oxoacyl-[acyl-carrier-protein] synthase III